MLKALHSSKKVLAKRVKGWPLQQLYNVRNYGGTCLVNADSKEEGNVSIEVDKKDKPQHRSGRRRDPFPLWSLASPLRSLHWPFNDRLPTLTFDWDDYEPLSGLMSADLIETATDYHIHCDAPGVENLEMKVSDGFLHITALRKKFHEIDNDFEHSIERSSGKISKMVSLPSDADVDKAQAQYKDGIVHVSFPKKEGGGVKKIPIDEVK